jgi:ornithine cyclodeaminase/alanine dehydrogenase-like protein (mu-crystallin family)
MSIPVFTPKQIAAAVDIADMLDPVADCLVDYCNGRAASGPIGLLALPFNGEAHLKSGFLTGRRYFVTKVATMCPHNRTLGKPSSNGMMMAFDAVTGEPVAVLHDAKRLTDLRTAAVGALAARHLARADAYTLGVLGSGGQAFLQARAVALVREIRSIHVWGIDPEDVRAFADKLGLTLPETQVHVESEIQSVVEQADVLVTATASKSPLVKGEWLKPGLHITAMGADDEFKRELDSLAVTRADLRIVDSRELAERYGDLSKKYWPANQLPEVHGELGQVISGMIAGRTAPTQITLSKHIGIGIEDVAAAEVALGRLL